MDHPAIVASTASPWVRAKDCLARMMHPDPSEITKPRRLGEKGRLACSGGTAASPSLGMNAPPMVPNPATMGSTRGKSTAPQMATSARPSLISMAPMIMEVTPVAQAVMVVVMGPVAPVCMETLPPTMLMQALGLTKGGGQFALAHQPAIGPPGRHPSRRWRC